MTTEEKNRSTPAWSFHEIESLDDPVYDDWLDLYQKAFPLCEQLLVSAHNKTLRNWSSFEHFVAALDPVTGALIAMARYDVMPEIGASVLWYLAVQRQSRSQGVGSELYGAIKSQIRAQSTLVRCHFIEVEDPAHTGSSEQRAEAERRIAFYERNGAVVIDGIRYEQSVGWQPAMPMRLMVQPMATAVGDVEILDHAKALFGNDITTGRARRPSHDHLDSL